MRKSLFVMVGQVGEVVLGLDFGLDFFLSFIAVAP